MVDGNSIVGFPQFDTFANAMKFVRSQKKHSQIQTNKLWVAENRSRMERNQAKIASKVKQFFTELANIPPKDVIVSYKLFKVIVRDSGKLMPIAFVKDDLTIEWNDARNVAAMVQEAMKDFISDMEWGMYNGGLVDSRKTATGNGSDKPSPIAANDADHIEHCVHVIVKNLQSSGCKSRWQIFIAELDQCDFNLLLICETWRGERDESSSRKEVITSFSAVAPIIKALEFAHRPILLHKLRIYLSMHIQIGYAACISLWPSGGQEF